MVNGFSHHNSTASRFERIAKDFLSEQIICLHFTAKWVSCRASPRFFSQQGHYAPRQLRGAENEHGWCWGSVCGSWPVTHPQSIISSSTTVTGCSSSKESCTWMHGCSSTKECRSCSVFSLLNSWSAVKWVNFKRKTPIHSVSPVCVLWVRHELGKMDISLQASLPAYCHFKLALWVCIGWSALGACPAQGEHGCLKTSPFLKGIDSLSECLFTCTFILWVYKHLS